MKIDAEKLHVIIHDIVNLGFVVHDIGQQLTIETKRIENFPIILVGADYWKGMLSWLRDTVLKSGRINKKEFKLFRIIDKPEKIVKFIDNFYSKRRKK